MKQLTLDPQTFNIIEVEITSKDIARLRLTSKHFKKGGEKHDCHCGKECTRNCRQNNHSEVRDSSEK